MLPALNTDYDPNILTKVTNASALQRNILLNDALQREAQAYPEDRRYELEQRNYLKQKNDLELQNLKNVRDMAPVVKGKALAEHMNKDVIPKLTVENYEASRQTLQQMASNMGLDKALYGLKPLSLLEQEAQEQGTTVKDLINKFKLESVEYNDQTKRITAEAHTVAAQADLLKALKTKEATWGTPTKGTDENGNNIYFQTSNEGVTRILKDVKPPDTDKKWSSPQKGIDAKGNPIVYQVDAKGNKRIIEGVQPEPKKGLRVYDSNGNLIVDTTGGDITPKTKGDIETKITNGKEQLARIKAISSEFKPEYQEIGTRLKASWTGIMARLGEGVSKEDMQALTDFKKFQRKAIENINLYIKEITGAQMSQLEAGRLRLAMPDPGEKWYSGDDPITFKAKMDDTEKYTRAAIARFEYYLSKGFTSAQVQKMVKDGSAISLDSMVDKMK